MILLILKYFFFQTSDAYFLIHVYIPYVRPRPIPHFWRHFFPEWR